MNIKQVKYSKEYKVGLPNYSNITVGMEMTVELAENEKVNHDAIWDEINHQIYIQTDIEPAWMRTMEYKDFNKLIIKVPKNRIKEDETVS